MDHHQGIPRLFIPKQFSQNPIKCLYLRINCFIVNSLPQIKVILLTKECFRMNYAIVPFYSYRNPKYYNND